MAGQRPCYTSGQIFWGRCRRKRCQDRHRCHLVAVLADMATFRGHAPEEGEQDMANVGEPVREIEVIPRRRMPPPKPPQPQREREAPSPSPRRRRREKVPA
jgi:hypothetical protein